MNDPRTVLDAVVEAESTNVGGINCKKITIGRYAWLEMIGSPFIDIEKKFNVSNLVASLYICQLDTDELKKYSKKDVQKIEDDAMAWAETVDLDKIGPAVDFILDQFKTIMKIAPGTGSAEDGKKKLKDSEMTTE